MPKGVYKRTKPAWNKGLTKEDPRVAINHAHKEETNLKRYGVTNVLRSKEVLEKVSEDRASGELARRAAETKKQRYGDAHYNNMEKNHQTKEARYGDPNYNNMDKMLQTKRVNNSFNTSKPEEQLYEKLLQVYSEKDIIRQYKESRYPYNCDFYIKSKDLFIELNYHQSHGDHPYDPENAADQKLIAFWRSKQNTEGPQNQYWLYEKVFTRTDPEKLKCAKDNKLNYLIIYKNSLEIKIQSRRPMKIGGLIIELISTQ